MYAHSYKPIIVHFYVHLDLARIVSFGAEIRLIKRLFQFSSNGQTSMNNFCLLTLKQLDVKTRDFYSRKDLKCFYGDPNARVIEVFLLVSQSVLIVSQSEGPTRATPRPIPQ